MCDAEWDFCCVNCNKILYFQSAIKAASDILCIRKQILKNSQDKKLHLKNWVFSVPRLWSLKTKKQGRGWGWSVGWLNDFMLVIRLDIFFHVLKTKLLHHSLLPGSVIMTTVQIYSCLTLWKWEIIAEYPHWGSCIFCTNSLVVWKWECWECTLTMKWSGSGKLTLCNLFNRELQKIEQLNPVVSKAH